jgi:Tol biopolymer transport system component
MRRSLVVALGLTAAAAALGPLAAPLGAEASHLLVFDSSRSGRFRIYTQMPGGPATLLVRDGGGNDFAPAVSPRGRKIVYSRRANGNYDLYIASVAKGIGARLTKSPAVDAFPAWSSTGEIAFESTRADGANYDIYVWETGHVRRLTAATAVDGLPTWSPDGSHIAFDSNRNGHFQIMRMPAHGPGKPVPLTPASSNAVQPAWSPNGSSIAFAGKASGNYQIYVVDVHTLAVTRVTTDSANDYQPSWAPDGSRIAYVSDAGGHHRMWTIGPDGQTPTQVSDTAGELPAWLS